MQNFKRIATGIDTTLLLEGLEKHPELWDIITARQNTPDSPHTDTKCIFLRGPKELTINSIFHDLESVDYDSLKTYFPFMNDIHGLLGKLIDQDSNVDPIGRVMIVSLKTGGVITKHIDEGDYADHHKRYHLVLQSDPLNIFYSETEDKIEEVHMTPGELWWFDHKAPHWVENMSDRERIHIIFDIKKAMVQ